METEEYLSLIKEQLRAYNFEEVSTEGFSQPVFLKSDEYTLGTKVKIVVITRINESSVEAVKDLIAEVKEGIYSEYWGLSGDQDIPDHNYLLIVPSESTNPMKTAVRREAEGLSSDAFFLPMIVDLQEETLAYKDSGLILHWEHRMMVRNLNDYFKL